MRTSRLASSRSWPVRRPPSAISPCRIRLSCAPLGGVVRNARRCTGTGREGVLKAVGQAFELIGLPAVTDSDGRFSIARLEESWYRLVAEYVGPPDATATSLHGHQTDSAPDEITIDRATREPSRPRDPQVDPLFIRDRHLPRHGCSAETRHHHILGGENDGPPSVARRTPTRSDPCRAVTARKCSRCARSCRTSQ